jgi:hypothetical protein
MVNWTGHREVLCTTLQRSILLVILLAVVGCAGAQRQLLQVDDWRSMPDEELLSYYFRLDEEIERCLARRTGAGVGVGTGIGTGIGAGRIGLGIGVTRGISGCPTERLWERRALVRTELRSRGLIP